MRKASLYALTSCLLLSSAVAFAAAPPAKPAPAPKPPRPRWAGARKRPVEQGLLGLLKVHDPGLEVHLEGDA